MLFALAVTAHAADAATFTGKVVAVQDGDTILVMRGYHAERMRLHGVDAPEGGQDFSDRAKQFLSSLVFGRVVKVEYRGIDRYGRTVGRVLVDGRDAGLALVWAGLAWHHVRYSKDVALASAEREARGARRGLWVKASPIPPWEFRRVRRRRALREPDVPKLREGIRGADWRIHTIDAYG